MSTLSLPEGDVLSFSVELASFFSSSADFSFGVPCLGDDGVFVPERLLSFVSAKSARKTLPSEDASAAGVVSPPEDEDERCA